MIVIIVTAINYFSVSLSGAIQVMLTAAKIIAVLLIIVGGLFFGAKHRPKLPRRLRLHSAWRHLACFSPRSFPQCGLTTDSTISAIWAKRSQHPEKNIPRAILLGLATIGILYLMANLTYFHVLPVAAAAASPHIASDVVQSFAGSRGAAWLTVAMAISALGALHVVIMTGARIPFAMARDGVFFRFAARLHPTTHAPSGSLAFLGTVATLLALTGTFEELYSLFVFAVWIFFALTAIALLRLRWKEPDLVRPYRVWGYPLTPLIFLIAAIALTVNLWMVRPVRSTLGLAVILGGIPFYYRWRKNSSSSSA